MELNFEINREIDAKPRVKYCWLANWYPLKNKENQVIGNNAVAQEITERKRSDDMLRDRRQRLEMTLETAGMGT